MQFFAAVREGDEIAIRVLDVDAALQKELSTEFKRQADAILDQELDEVAFDPKRPIEKDSQVSVISGYTLPPAFAAAAKQPDQYDALMPGKSLPPIKTLFAVEGSDATKTRILFQAFQSTRLLQQNRITVLFRQSTLHRLNQAGLTFDNKLACVFMTGNLYFKSFHLAHTCLSLADYLAEATDQEITRVLESAILDVEDAKAVAQICDGWMRRRFAAIKTSGILKRVTPKEVQRKAKRFGIRFKTRQVDGELKIAWPETKKEMKNALRFLNEGYYEGELTGTLFSTDSNSALKNGAG